MLKWMNTRVMAPDGDDGGTDGGTGGGDGNGGDGDAGKGGKDAAGKTILDSAAAGAGGATGANGDGDGKEGDWSWGENVPGTGTIPPWFKTDKYKTVTDQAKAAPELEAKLGPAADLIGAPEKDYEMPGMPDGIEGEWDLEDPMLVTFKEIAKENDLSQGLFDKVVQKFGALLASETAAEEKAVSDALAELGTNSAQRIEAVRKYMIAELGEEGYNALNDMVGTDVKAYTYLEKLVAKAAGDAQLSSLPGKSGPGFTKADIEAEQYKVYPEGHKMAGRSIYEHDKEHRAKVDAMWKELFPGEDVQIVG